MHMPEGYTPTRRTLTSMLLLPATPIFVSMCYTFRNVLRRNAFRRTEALQGKSFSEKEEGAREQAAQK
eukprot:12903618-Alexandrium_andersonii.AAC.1